MLTFIQPTEEELKIAKNCGHYNRQNSIKKNYLNKIFKKPWGYEYLTYQTEQIGIWILHVLKNQKTSLHCHFKKGTILMVLSGCFRIDLYDRFHILNECEMLYFPANAFHGIMSYVEEGIILEIEIYSDNITYTDKNDLLRLRDVYNRDKNSYENSVDEKEVMPEESINFHLQDNIKLGNSTIHIENCKQFLESTNHDLTILLKGKVFQNNILNPGSIIKSCEYIDNISGENTIYMRISNNYKTENSKIIHSKEQLIDLIEKNKYKNIGLTSGCFDIMHNGHINNLKLCKKQCDVLFVCLSSDKQIKELKGESRPINNINDRTNMLSNMSFIDYIILYDELDNATEKELDNIMTILNPDYWFKGTDYNVNEIRYKHPSLKNICLFDNIPNKSTTNIIEQIKNK